MVGSALACRLVNPPPFKLEATLPAAPVTRNWLAVVPPMLNPAGLVERVVDVPPLPFPVKVSEAVLPALVMVALVPATVSALFNVTAPALALVTTALGRVA